jgi:uncharacterized membrane protein
LIHAAGWPFDYFPSHQAAESRGFDSPHCLFILSDYPARNLAPALQQRLLEQVARGAGLLMLGGWESYHGSGGDWQGTAVAQALPVAIGEGDDRLNCDHPVLLRRRCDHPAVRDLPWESRPPVIGGLNRIAPKSGATVVLEAQHFLPHAERESFVFEPARVDPLLVVGQYGQGRVAALATDVAPHWVGGLVDWGTGRLAAQAPGAEAIEVGDLYARFFQQLLAWTGQIDVPGGNQLPS